MTLKTIWVGKWHRLGWADTDGIKGEKLGPKYNKCGFSYSSTAHWRFGWFSRASILYVVIQHSWSFPRFGSPTRTQRRERAYWELRTVLWCFDLEGTCIRFAHSHLARICHTPLLIYKQPEKCRDKTGDIWAGGAFLPLPHQEKATLRGELTWNDTEFPPPGIISDLD